MIEFMSLLIEVKPISYPGRIIISTTDDIESKVIKNYGGRKWKRVVNFLRGVDLDSTELGVKFGEAYVELRESNVPNHTHEVKTIIAWHSQTIPKQIIINIVNWLWDDC